MNIIRLVKQASLYYLIAAISTGVASGLLLTLLIRMIHQSLLIEEPDPVRFLGFYMLVWIAFVACTTLATILTSNMAHKALYNLREWVTDHILNVSYRKAEGRGAEFFPVLTEDIQKISYTIYRIPAITTASATVLGCFIYMLYLSWAITLTIVLLFVLIYLVMSKLGSRAQYFGEQARQEYDRIYRFFEDLVYGLKELKLNPYLRNHYRSTIFPPLIKSHQNLKLKENILFNFSIRTVEILFFPALGVLVYSIIEYGISSPGAFSGVLTVLLFMLSPLSTMANFVTEYKAMQISLTRVNQLEDEILTAVELTENQVDLPTKKGTGPVENILEFENVQVSYRREDGITNFILGPVTTRFPAQKIIFITGDNGSGKSTFAKVITGLYPPEQGSIKYMGTPITKQNLSAYRAKFSSVFSDFHLFSELAPETCGGQNLAGWIERFGISNYVNVQDEHISTTKLSQGQRERLAFAFACSYPSEIIVLDEVSSNQDAGFRHKIYFEILPELKAAGKTIVVITHDERYFSIADVVLKFEYGKLMES
jgi:putative pyoverdin transport system ATP-binding/permease protein